MHKKSLTIAAVFFCASLCAFPEGDLTVTEIPGIVGWGSISPDGGTLVIAKGENSDSLVLYDLESGKEKPVLKGRVIHYPRLDPECRKIIFSGEKPYAGLWIVGTDGKGLAPFPSKEGANADDFGALWSPDGSMVVWGRDSQLWIANADGSGARALTKKPVKSKYLKIGQPIDWIEDKILMKGWVQSSPNFYVADASSGKYGNVGMEYEGWAQFCDSPDFLMYYHYCDQANLRIWSVTEMAEATDAGPLKMDGDIESIDTFTRSADSTILLINNEDPNSASYLHMYLITMSDDE